MFCKFCGEMIDKDSVFCMKCGKKLSQDETQLDMANDEPATVVDQGALTDALINAILHDFKDTPIGESMANSAVEPVAESIVEPVVEPVVELIVEPVVEPIVQPVVEPVSEQIVASENNLSSSLKLGVIAEAPVPPVVDIPIEAVPDNMIVEKRRICPKCGERNPSNKRTCMSCDASLASARIISLHIPDLSNKVVESTANEPVIVKGQCPYCSCNVRIFDTHCPRCGSKLNQK